MIENQEPMQAEVVVPKADKPPIDEDGLETPKEAKRRSFDDSIIKWLAVIFIVAILAFAVSVPDAAADAIGVARTFVTEYFTWFFVLFSIIALGMCGWLAFGRFGSIRLGGSKAKPDYSKFAWYSMLFACGQGIGLIFWSVEVGS